MSTAGSARRVASENVGPPRTERHSAPPKIAAVVRATGVSHLVLTPLSRPRTAAPLVFPYLVPRWEIGTIPAMGNRWPYLIGTPVRAA